MADGQSSTRVQIWCFTMSIHVSPLRKDSLDDKWMPVSWSVQVLRLPVATGDKSNILHRGIVSRTGSKAYHVGYTSTLCTVFDSPCCQAVIRNMLNNFMQCLDKYFINMDSELVNFTLFDRLSCTQIMCIKEGVFDIKFALFAVAGGDVIFNVVWFIV